MEHLLEQGLEPLQVRARARLGLGAAGVGIGHERGLVGGDERAEAAVRDVVREDERLPLHSALHGALHGDVVREDERLQRARHYAMHYE